MSNKAMVLNWSESSILLASILVILFSYGFPSKIDGGFLFDHFPKIYQIVALGRFGFPFYYVVAILCVVSFSRLIRSHYYSFVVGFLIAFLFISESIPMHLQIKQLLGHRPNMFNEKIFDEHYQFQEWNVEANEFDAILPLPIYIFYAVPFIRNSTLATEEFSFATSVRTGLPINAVYLSRASIGNSKTILDLVEDKSNYFALIFIGILSRLGIYNQSFCYFRRPK